MPKAAKKNYYAVANGLEGPKIYNSWDECKENTSRYPGAKHKGFLTFQDAQDWLAHQISLSPNRKEYPESDSEVEIVSISPAPSTSTSKQKQKAPNHESDDSDIEIIEPPPSTSSANADPTEIVLSPEQRKVLSKVKSGKNVFFTGSAGTGKSVLLREIIRHFRESNRNVAITASTGMRCLPAQTFADATFYRYSRGEHRRKYNPLLGRNRSG
ncbi:hypothetical protein GYMLUDRAFT_332817 [Collybiopsis luxurians FD-317 M1]|nr:hypothetical protein GYMLUDRAFT_332817 [Collybiopsis luxurians FD-317 M1]